MARDISSFTKRMANQGFTGIDVAELVLHRGAEPLIALTVAVKNTPLVGQLEFRAALKQLTFQLFCVMCSSSAARVMLF